MFSATRGAIHRQENFGMGSKGLQLTAYVVLVAILLATGLGALGTAAVLL